MTTAYFNTPLYRYIHRYVSFSQVEYELFCSFLEEVHYPKKTFLLKEGQVCHHQYFLLEGLVRCFYIDQNGQEKITQFAIEHWWFSSLESFKRQLPSKLNIQALEDTTVLAISWEQLEAAFNALPKLERLFRIITENWLIAQQRSSFFYRKTNSKAKYLHFLEQLPDFAQRIPQYMLASYLDISPEYLSELRKKH